MRLFEIDSKRPSKPTIKFFDVDSGMFFTVNVAPKTIDIERMNNKNESLSGEDAKRFLQLMKQRTVVPSGEIFPVEF